MIEERHVVVVGDGPAGAMVAAGLRDRDVPCVVVGPGERWTPTYGSWADDLADCSVLGSADIASQLVESVRFAALDEHDVARPYLVVDNDRLATVLFAGVDRRIGRVCRIVPDAGGARVELDDRTSLEASLVIDATGAGSEPDGRPPQQPMAWQTAWGVVLDEVPAGPLGRATVMDWTSPGGVDESIPTFGYALPVADGWLVEETVLAAAPAVDPASLRPVLARRLGWSIAELDERTRRVERVHIPMGSPIVGQPPAGAPAVVRVGAASGLAHPATGYLVAPMARTVDRVADAIAAARTEPVGVRAAQAWEAIWEPALRRTRAFHEFGLDVLLRLDADGTRQFFETFFSLPSDVWPHQMRVDTPPAQIAALMLQMFRSAPWSLRRRLVSGDLRRLARVVRPAR
ncbi:MAG: lycopene cyclase family protein [Actinomycetota bacterium]